MQIRAACPHCGKRFRVDDKYVGKSTDCSGCRQRFIVVESNDVDTPVPSTASASQASSGTPGDSHIDSSLLPPTPSASAPVTSTVMTVGQKKCPLCAEWIAQEAIKCRHCNSMLVPVEDASRRRERDPRLIYPSSSPTDPILAAMLSGCCIAGLGQMVLGQVTKGVISLICSVVLAVLTMGFSVLITFPLMGIDAYLVASKLKSGRPVSDWESFPG